MKLIIKFIFNRLTLAFLFLSLQFLVILTILLKFKDYFVFFYEASMAMSMIFAIFILAKKSKPSYKLSWMIFILLLPIFGGMLYLFFGSNRLTKKHKVKIKKIEKRIRTFLIPENSVLDEMRTQSETAANQSKYIQDFSLYPPHTHTITEYLSTGEKTFKQLKEELNKAEYFIFLEYFIINEGVMWNSIFDILVKKASQGLDVRIIYDDLGSLFTLPYGFKKKLEKKGIKCLVFNPLKFILSSRINYRDHRKIAVIDGHTGFTGGINLADEYINKSEKYGDWKDTAVLLKGEAVWNLTVMFLSVWNNLEGNEEDYTNFKNSISINSNHKHGYIQPFADSPDPIDNESIGETVYLNLIYKAKRYVYITTPYLIIDNEMIFALTSAAKSGVDVKIITPHFADKLAVHEVTRSHYQVLIEGGVKIYEYTPGFIHSKTYVADDIYGIVGSINMDYRSLYLQFECGVWMFNCHSIIDIKEDFINILKKCTEITIEDINKICWLRKVVRLLLRGFSPLL